MNLLFKYHAHPRTLLEVSKEAFSPKPNVNPMVIELDFETPHPGRLLNNERYFKKIVKGAFATVEGR